MYICNTYILSAVYIYDVDGIFIIMWNIKKMKNKRYDFKKRSENWSEKTKWTKKRSVKKKVLFWSELK